MAVPHPPTATDIEPLTPDEIARIPSAALPISLQISHLLSEFTRLSVQLFAIISTTSPSLVAGARGSAPTDAVYDALAQIDEKLASLLGMYDAHQQRQRRIEALIGELSRLDSNWRSSALRLEACVAELDPILASGKLDRIAIDRAKEAKMTPDGLLAYARLIAPFTSAPPASLFPPEIKLKGVGATDPTGRTLPPGAIPPFPTEATMRKGRLQFGREGLLQGYLGETEQVGAGRRDSATGALLPPDPTTTAGKPADTAARLEHEAKAHAAASALTTGAVLDGAEPEAEDFVFDLDLNPDM
ncbi:hypothetical protein BMF94_4841 [Rhodotorula taiwanensis]|uniref:Mediator of RNA polymerase II transcription subunit 4 n=1 Tax=Rhodotorula taiwanensis TaxID=741276 RepID=A0A2S5B5Q6_9BASI|nr:hypothetical protein BMF94_4841 [Rhodotorula taiwanensis]